jgi:hypothetical protein
MKPIYESHDSQGPSFALTGRPRSRHHDAHLAGRHGRYAQEQVGGTRDRYVRSFKENSLDSLRSLAILQTRPEHFLYALEVGAFSNNDILSRVQNFSLAMPWLPWRLRRY